MTIAFEQSCQVVPLSGFIIDKRLKVLSTAGDGGVRVPCLLCAGDVAAPKNVEKIPLIKSPSRGSGAYETT